MGSVGCPAPYGLALCLSGGPFVSKCAGPSLKVGGPARYGQLVPHVNREWAALCRCKLLYIVVADVERVGRR